MRYHKLDEIRGITLISMILYHGCWDAVYILGYDWGWYHSDASYIWQQSIAWTFILLSGFCWQLGKRRLRRGLTVFGAGFVVTAATMILMPENRIIFGVLTLIGSSMLLLIPLDRGLRKTPIINEEDGSSGFGVRAGLIVSGVLFFLTRNVNRGFLGFEGLNMVQLPESWFCNGFSAFLGFPYSGFFSTDYFSLIPWFFLFLCGYFLFHTMKSADALKHLAWENQMPETPQKKNMAPIRWMGRHSLLIYLLHQPILYGLVLIIR